ncbi:hypothetical protein H6P81_011613 [Aristolochia fimbriata]|uniref:Epidermal patterning factor-like protein n=1 Tax=Aristolochia fimbriata TaxID=158543 RepID=A0AAV7ESH8_ARIFI|nr:hypothetical protein H6P81_011613 [Aristolochia fimbriata]
MKLFLYSLKHQPSSLLVVILFLAVVNARSPRVEEENIPAGMSTKGVLIKDERHLVPKEGSESTELGMELFPTGSSLPDCTHACGPCFPCKRVMVSFKCSLAESCPIVYRCMCKGKYYHVPSS